MKVKKISIKAGDLLVYLFAVVLVMAGFLGVYVMGAKSDSSSVVVEVDGREVYSTRIYDGMKPVEFRVDVGDGRHNIVLITYEEVRIKQADCPDQLCVKWGAIRYPGQAIICLPHRVVVKIIGRQEESPEVDDIAS
jgi:hypothetical protein